METTKIFKDINIDIIQNDSCIIHRFYINFVASYIIETKNNLIVIDTQETPQKASLLLDYVGEINKNIYGVFITHSHWDHCNQISAFKNHNIFALEQTLQEMQLDDGFNKVNLNDGTLLRVDNVDFIIKNMENSHCSNHMVIIINSINAIISGDLVMGNLDSNPLLIYDFDGFIHAMEYFISMDNIEYYLSSHGKITNKNVLITNLEYLKNAKNIYNSSLTLQEYQLKIQLMYPNINKNVLDTQLKWLSLLDKYK